jgi:hypothetical protein
MTEAQKRAWLPLEYYNGIFTDGRSTNTKSLSYRSCWAEIRIGDFSNMIEDY